MDAGLPYCPAIPYWPEVPFTAGGDDRGADVEDSGLDREDESARLRWVGKRRASPEPIGLEASSPALLLASFTLVGLAADRGNRGMRVNSIVLPAWSRAVTRTIN